MLPPSWLLFDFEEAIRFRLDQRCFCQKWQLERRRGGHRRFCVQYRRLRKHSMLKRDGVRLLRRWS